jgi:hypothetical protein
LDVIAATVVGEADMQRLVEVTEPVTEEEQPLRSGRRCSGAAKRIRVRKHRRHHTW